MVEQGGRTTDSWLIYVARCYNAMLFPDGCLEEAGMPHSSMNTMMNIRKT